MGAAAKGADVAAREPEERADNYKFLGIQKQMHGCKTAHKRDGPNLLFK